MKRGLLLLRAMSVAYLLLLTHQVQADEECACEPKCGVPLLVDGECELTVTLTCEVASALPAGSTVCVSCTAAPEEEEEEEEEDTDVRRELKGKRARKNKKSSSSASSPAMLEDPVSFELLLDIPQVCTTEGTFTALEGTLSCTANDGTVYTLSAAAHGFVSEETKSSSSGSMMMMSARPRELLASPAMTVNKSRGDHHGVAVPSRFLRKGGTKMSMGSSSSSSALVEPDTCESFLTVTATQPPPTTITTTDPPPTTIITTSLPATTITTTDPPPTTITTTDPPPTTITTTDPPPTTITTTDPPPSTITTTDPPPTTSITTTDPPPSTTFATSETLPSSSSFFF